LTRISYLINSGRFIAARVSSDAAARKELGEFMAGIIRAGCARLASGLLAALFQRATTAISLLFPNTSHQFIKK
jgi:hypothetical protein